MGYRRLGISGMFRHALWPAVRSSSGHAEFTYRTGIGLLVQNPSELQVSFSETRSIRALRGEKHMEMESTPTAFAVLDILGYGSLMAKEPEAVLTLVQELLQSSVRNRLVQHDLDEFTRISGAGSAPLIEYLQFSDTLIIYLREDKFSPQGVSTPSQLVQSICYAASLTLASFIATGIPLRGAVGFGRTFISKKNRFSLLVRHSPKHSSLSVSKYGQEPPLKIVRKRLWEGLRTGHLW